MFEHCLRKMLMKNKAKLKLAELKNKLNKQTFTMLYMSVEVKRVSMITKLNKL
ncbi:unnamed protein product [Brugia timori]|uniref:Uncharacterized protein n=1 Tax=Brugia timori TaxID=42155 RepID=A0A0R3Q8X8_9BILA|nr:unnamed protein product [Brugia timori]